MENHYFTSAGTDDPRECICGADVADHPEPGDLEPSTYTPEPSNVFDFERFEFGE